MIASGQLNSAQPDLSPREFEEIRALAYRAFGLDLRPGKEEMVAARLGRLVAAGGYRSFHEYAQSVEADSTGVLLASLVDALATNHTAFLREPSHFEFFCRQGAAESNPAALDIWCAACSTGEEVWSLLCMWNDFHPNRALRICATDISNRALRRAHAAEYSTESCAPLPAAWLKRFFELVPEPRERHPGAHYRVTRQLRDQVQFRRMNLMDPFPWLRPFSAIFCRNVMIYFDRQTQQQVVRRIATCLEPGGYLFTGHAESLAGFSHPLEYVQPAIYRKAPGRELPWKR